MIIKRGQGWPIYKTGKFWSIFFSIRQLKPIFLVRSRHRLDIFNQIIPVEIDDKVSQRCHQHHQSGQQECGTRKPFESWIVKLAKDRISGDGCESSKDREDRENFSDFVIRKGLWQKRSEDRVLAVAEHVEAGHDVKVPELRGQRGHAQADPFEWNNDEEDQGVVQLKLVAQEGRDAD